MFSYGETILFLFIPDFSSTIATHITYGRLAFLLYLFIWITSAMIRDKINYRPWLYIHYFSYPLLFFVFIHVFEIGTFIFAFPLIKYYCFFLLGIFILLIIFKIFRFLNIDKTRYKLIDIDSKKR